MIGSPHDPREDAVEELCYLTTTGRRSGRFHEIEIWFAFAPDTETPLLYMMAGGREGADWVRNLRSQPAALIRLAGMTWTATARFVTPGTPEDRRVRELLCGKYQGWRAGRPLGEWGQTALPVAFALGEAGWLSGLCVRGTGDEWYSLRPGEDR